MEEEEEQVSSPSSSSGAVTTCCNTGCRQRAVHNRYCMPCLSRGGRFEPSSSSPPRKKRRKPNPNPKEPQPQSVRDKKSSRTPLGAVYEETTNEKWSQPSDDHTQDSSEKVRLQFFPLTNKRKEKKNQRQVVSSTSSSSPPSSSSSNEGDKWIFQSVKCCLSSRIKEPFRAPLRQYLERIVASVSERMHIGSILFIMCILHKELKDDPVTFENEDINKLAYRCFTWGREEKPKGILFYFNISYKNLI
jgi:hypothetical protein